MTTVRPEPSRGVGSALAGAEQGRLGDRGRSDPFDAQLAGEFDIVSDDFRSLTGREPLTVAEVISRHCDEMPLADRRPERRRYALPQTSVATCTTSSSFARCASGVIALPSALEPKPHCVESARRSSGM